TLVVQFSRSTYYFVDRYRLNGDSINISHRIRSLQVLISNTYQSACPICLSFGAARINVS
ncbi:hypothetical protein, partial [Paenibacillus turpanensis]|uniref:hypothetical protein n=1 Tax=Paenibacillus turpanensis TaxID=2689078 RepID=UPI001A9ECE0D